ncbi:MAG: hypothetical protein Q8P13_01870 [bacterium]|nr:hypothetical protein [bacterium]
MDEKDLQAIQGLLRKELKTELAPMKDDLEEVKETTNANNTSLMNLEKEIGIYNDALDIERKRVDKHEERLAQLEVT